MYKMNGDGACITENGPTLLCSEPMLTKSPNNGKNDSEKINAHLESGRNSCINESPAAKTKCRKQIVSKSDKRNNNNNTVFENKTKHSVTSTLQHNTEVEANHYEAASSGRPMSNPYDRHYMMTGSGHAGTVTSSISASQVTTTQALANPLLQQVTGASSLPQVTPSLLSPEHYSLLHGTGAAAAALHAGNGSLFRPPGGDVTRHHSVGSGQFGSLYSTTPSTLSYTSFYGTTDSSLYSSGLNPYAAFYSQYPAHGYTSLIGANTYPAGLGDAYSAFLGGMAATYPTLPQHPYISGSLPQSRTIGAISDQRPISEMSQRLGSHHELSRHVSDTSSSHRVDKRVSEHRHQPVEVSVGHARSKIPGTLPTQTRAYSLSDMPKDSESRSGSGSGRESHHTQRTSYPMFTRPGAADIPRKGISVKSESQVRGSQLGPPPPLQPSRTKDMSPGSTTNVIVGPASASTRGLSPRQGVAVPPVPPGGFNLHYPEHFRRGSLIQLANGQLKPVEELKTNDFIQSADISGDLKIDTSRVRHIEEHTDRGVAILTFLVGQVQAQVTVEATLEHPFFVYGQGWTSVSPSRTQHKYGLSCKQLKVNDVCVSLTNITRQTRPAATAPPIVQSVMSHPVEHAQGGGPPKKRRRWSTSDIKSTNNT